MWVNCAHKSQLTLFGKLVYTTSKFQNGYDYKKDSESEEKSPKKLIPWMCQSSLSVGIYNT